MEPFASVSFLEGLSNRAGAQVQVRYSRGIASLADMVSATEFRTAESGGERGVRAEYFASPKLAGTPFLGRPKRGSTSGRLPARTFPNRNSRRAGPATTFRRVQVPTTSS